MDCLGGDVFTEEIFRDLIGSVLRASEDEDCLDFLILQDMEKKVILVASVYEKYRLCNDIDGRRDWCDGDVLGIMEYRLREFDNLWWHCRREKECLTTFWNEFQEFSDIVDESHIEHAIRLVENKDL